MTVPWHKILHKIHIAREKKIRSPFVVIIKCLDKPNKFTDSRIMSRKAKIKN